MIANKYNKNSGSKFTYELPEGATFKNLKDFATDVEYPVRGFYISKGGKFGDEAVMIVDNARVNLPSHTLDTVREMLTDDELIEAVNAGKFGFKVHTYEDKKYGKGTCYSVDWVDL